MTPDYVSKYTYRIDWSEEDECFLGKCLEFPSLVAHGASRERALKEIQLVVVESVKWMIEEEEELPVPLSLRSYSGKLSLRIPPETHRRLSIEAAEERVSLNQHLTSLLESRQGSGSIKKSVSAVFDKLDRLEAAIQQIAVMVSNSPRIALSNWIGRSQANFGTLLEANPIHSFIGESPLSVIASSGQARISNATPGAVPTEGAYWTSRRDRPEIEGDCE